MGKVWTLTIVILYFKTISKTPRMNQLRPLFKFTLVAMVVLWTSCQKEANNQATNEQNQNGKAMGADALDLLEMNKVPLIISSDFGQPDKYAPTLVAGKGKPPSTTADVTAPSVAITSPANGSAVSGTVSIMVSASDNVGVNTVTIAINGAIVSTFAAAPYSYSWNTTSIANGNYTLTATAKDAAGNTKVVSSVVSKNTVIVVTPPPTTTLPTSFSLVMPPVQNQGSEGSCIAFAVAYARSYEAFKRTNATSYSTSTNILSPEYLFNQTKSSTTCSGSALLTSLNFVRDNGICTWGSMPYTWTGCSLMPTSTQTTEASKYRILSYSQVYASDITAIKTMIAAKRPLVSQYTVDSQFYNAGPGFIWKSFSGAVGAHGLVICGYDDSKNAFKVINQWGTTWGDAGYTWIDYSFLKTVSSNLCVMNF